MAIGAGKGSASNGSAAPARYMNEPVTQVKISGTNFAFLGICSSSLETGVIVEIKIVAFIAPRGGGKRFEQLHQRFGQHGVGACRVCNVGMRSLV